VLPLMSQAMAATWEHREGSVLTVRGYRRAAGIAVHNAATASRQHAIALSRQLAAESLALDPADPATARRLAVAAWRVFPTDQALSVMTALLAEQQQEGILRAVSSGSGVAGVAFSPDGKLLATAGGEGTVRLWNPATGQAVGAPLPAATGPGLAVTSMAFSPDGRLLASGDSHGTVRLWNPATGRAVGAPLPAATGPGLAVTSMAFSPDGKLLASTDADGTVRLWNPATRQLVRTPLPAATYAGSTLGATAVAFSPDRQAAGYRRRRRDRVAVEPGHRAACRDPPPGWGRERRDRGGVQPGRQGAGQRRRRWHRANVASVSVCRSLRSTVRRCRATDKGKLDAVRPS
jgi:hypothetical protein